MMTASEQLLWEYIEQESDDLVLRVLANVENDGFARGSRDKELVGLKVLSQAMVKSLALMVEGGGSRVSLAEAYSELVPVHVELVNLYLLKSARASR